MKSSIAHGLSLSLALFVPATSVYAQAIPDQSLPNPSIVNPSATGDTITGGTQAGTNLLHSFSQFSILPATIASFRHDAAIQNILVRVTGTSTSTIDGVLEALETTGNPSTANLFLINPNGIVFGRDASLNVGGSFTASTASSIKFGDGSEFSAIVPSQIPLLTVNVPTGLQFGTNPGSIVVRSQFLSPTSGFPIGLAVSPGQTLALVGGAVDLPGGHLTAPDGRIEVGSVGRNDLVEIAPASTGLRFGYNGVAEFQDFQFSGGGLIEVSGDTGGAVAIAARNITLREGAAITSYAFTQAQGGELSLNAANDINLIGTSIDASEPVIFSEIFRPSGVFSVVVPNVNGQGSSLNITARTLNITNGARVEASTLGEGQGGNLTANVSGTFSIGGGAIFPDGRELLATLQTASAGVGKSGDLTLNAGQLNLRNGGQITTVTETGSSGKAGALRIRVESATTLTGAADFPSQPFSSSISTQTKGSGAAGILQLNTRELRVLEGAQITSSTLSSGEAGVLNVEAETIEVSGVARGADGRFLTIPIPGDRPARISSVISADTQPNSIGRGADLTIATQRLTLRNGGIIQTATYGEGDSGNLTIRASDRIDIIGVAPSDGFPTSLLTLSGGIPGEETFFRVPGATGKGGNMTIATNTLRVREGGQLASSSLNPTQQARGAGDLMEVNANVVFLDRGKLNAETASGNGGNINLNVGRLLFLRDRSQVTTTAGREDQGGNGGNITIRSALIAAFPGENSDIRADAFTGSGGRVEVRGDLLFINPLSRAELEQQIQQQREFQSNPDLELSSVELATNDITAISQVNPFLSGTIITTSPEVDPNRGLIQLPTALVDPSDRIDQSCSASTARSTSQFVVQGQGGLPTNPNEPLMSADTIARLATFPDQNAAARSSASIPPVIREAQGIHRLQNGKIRFIAQNSSPPQTPSVNCRAAVREESGQ